jgi:hypothetical protein
MNWDGEGEEGRESGDHAKAGAEDGDERNRGRCDGRAGIFVRERRVVLSLELDLGSWEAV